MKITVAELLDPRYEGHKTMGERIIVLQHLMRSAHKYRVKGRWGESGPSEILNGHHGCTNAAAAPWSSGRRGCRTWEEHFHALGDALLGALCSAETVNVKWRADIGLSLGAVFAFRARKLAYAGDEEKKALAAFFALECTRLDPPHSFNSCHRRINVLWRPELLVCAEAVRLAVRLSDMTEIRRSKGGASSWSLGFLLREPLPAWKPCRDTFVEFLNRSVDFIKSRKATDAKKI